MAKPDNIKKYTTGAEENVLVCILYFMRFKIVNVAVNTVIIMHFIYY